MWNSLQRSRRSATLVTLILIVLCGLAYWMVSTDLLTTGVTPQQGLETQPSRVEHASQTNPLKAPDKAIPTTIPNSQSSEEKHRVRKGLIVLLEPKARIDPNGTLAKYLNMPQVSHHKLQHLNMITLVIPEEWELDPIHQEIAQDPVVQSVSKNALARGYQHTPGGVIPNDPLFAAPSQWGLSNISAPQAWRYTTGDETVIIAVMDSGLDYTHPDLVDNAWVNEAELNGLPLVDDDHPDGPRPCHPRIPDVDLFCDDVYGTATGPDHTSNDSRENGYRVSHGTAIASIIAASGNNGQFSTGVAWRAKVFPVAIFDRDINTDNIEIFQAADYLVAMKLERGVNIRAINYSGTFPTGSVQRAFFRALEDADILFVHAAGNVARARTDTNRFLPSPVLVRVAAIEQSGEIATFSNFGPLVHVAAPGVGIGTLIGRPTYSSVRIPALLLANVANSSNMPFTQWLVQPPQSWAAAQTGLGIKDIAFNPIFGSGGVLEPSIGTWYQSTQVTTTLTLPGEVDIRNHNFEDILFQITLRSRLDRDTFLILELGITTSASVVWHPVESWSNIDSSYLYYRFNLSSMFGGDGFQGISKFRLRFRTTPSMDSRNLVVIDNVRITAEPPIPAFSDIPQSEVSDYFPSLDGTSFAAPYVAGVAALIWAHRPELSAVQVRNILTNPENLDPFPCVKSNLPCVSSRGSLNAFKILTAITTPEISIFGVDEIVTQPNRVYAFPVRLHRAPGVINTSIDRVVFEAEISHRLDGKIIAQNTSLTFTRDNWYQPQLITLTTQADPTSNLLTIPDSEKQIISTFRLRAAESPDSDPDFAGTTAQKFVCLQKPGEQPLILGLCNPVSIEGEPITYHLALSQRPDSALNFSIAVIPGTAGTASPALIVFTPDNWNKPQTLTVHPGPVDLLHSDPRRFNLQAILSDASSNIVSSITQTIALLDNQTSPTIVFAPDDILLTGFSTRAATLRLGGQPASEVQVNLSSEPQGLLRLSADTLRFTPDNWNQAQTISLWTEHTGTFPTTITAQIDSDFSDPQYEGAAAVLPVLIRTQDLRILGLRDQTLVEGMSHEYALALSSTPNQTIRVFPVVEPLDSVLFTPRTLTFTPANWSTSQALSIHTSVDFQNAAIRTARIVLNSVSSHLMTPTTSRLTITDSGETPRFVVQPEQVRLTDAEPQTLSVRLNGNPDGKLELILTSSHPQWVRVSPSTITFTPQNWFEPQTFSVAALAFITTNTTVTIRPAPDSLDTQFRNAVKQIPVVVDRRAVRLVGFENQTVTEGIEHTYYLSLSATPGSTVSLRVGSLIGFASFNPVDIVFTEDNWNIPQPLTVRVFSRIEDHRDRIIPIFLEDRFGLLVESAIRFLTVLDDGRRQGPVGVVLEPSDSYFAARGHSATVNIRLAGQPVLSVPVEFMIYGVYQDAYQVRPSLLTFTIDNWNIPQNVEITSTRRSNFLFVELSIDFFNLYSILGSADQNYRVLGDIRKFVYPPLDVLGLADTMTPDEQIVVYNLRPGFANFVQSGAFPDQAYLSSPVTVIVSTEPPDAVDFEPQILSFPQGSLSQSQKLTVIPHLDSLQKQRSVVLRLSSTERFVRTTTAVLTIGQRVPQILSIPASELAVGRQSRNNLIHISLDIAPTSTFVISLSTSRPEFIVSPTTMTFTADNWDTTQTASVAADPGATAIASLNLVAELEDPDSLFRRRTKTLALHPQHLLGLRDLQLVLGDPGSYLLRLTSTPNETLVLTPEADPPDERLAFSPNRLIFTPDNWNIEQMFFVVALHGPSSVENSFVSIRFSDTPVQLLSTPSATLTILERPRMRLSTPVISVEVDKTMLTFSWLQVEKAVSYRADLYRGADAAGEFLGSGSDVRIDNNTGEVSTVISGLLPVTDYTLRVIAVAAADSDEFVDSLPSVRTAQSGKLTLSVPTDDEIEREVGANTIKITAVGFPPAYGRLYDDTETDIEYLAWLERDGMILIPQGTTETLTYPGAGGASAAHTFENLEADTHYDLVVVASSRDAAESFNTSAPARFSVRILPLTQLPVPAAITVKPDSRTAKITWVVSEDSAATTYLISLAGEEAVAVPVDDLNYVLKGLTMNTTYTLSVVAQAEDLRDSKPYTHVFKTLRKIFLRLRTFLESPLQ